MKIGKRDVWFRVGKWSITSSLLGREWIDLRPFNLAGKPEGFWQDVPRRLEISTPWGRFMMAYTPNSGWSEGTKEDYLNGTYRRKWIEWESRSKVA
jgi:hypothetical protein